MLFRPAQLATTRRLQECPMRTHRFGRKIKLPATIAIKHQIRKLMFEDSVKKAEAEPRAEVLRGPGRQLWSTVSPALISQRKSCGFLWQRWPLSSLHCFCWLAFIR